MLLRQFSIFIRYPLDVCYGIDKKFVYCMNSAASGTAEIKGYADVRFPESARRFTDGIAGSSGTPDQDVHPV
jgi:hypothetical protein